MRILFVGKYDSKGQTDPRAQALGRLGHEVTVIEPRTALPDWKVVDWWIFHQGALGLGGVIGRHVRRQTANERFDLAFIDLGSLVGPKLVRYLKRIAPIVVCFNQDNPFVPRDGNRWRQFLKALPEYDLLAVPRRSSLEAAYRHGAKAVIEIRQPVDELIARPLSLSDADRAKYSSEVAFVGTWMPERGPFFLRLVELGVPLRIFGPRWHKAPEYPALAPYITLGPLNREEYPKAIAGAKISLALLSKGNEDLHTSRSTEIPAIGSLLCGERTSDHLAMYHEGEEAIFFDSAEECADQCLALLNDPQRLARIRDAGHKRVFLNRTFSEHQFEMILNRAVEMTNAADL